MVCISNRTFLTGKKPDFHKGNVAAALRHSFGLGSVTPLHRVLIRRRIPVVIPHPASRRQMRQSVMFHRETLTDEVAAQRFVPHACTLASEEPNHNPQPAYKIPAANAGRMSSTRKSVFSVNSSDAHLNGSEEVQKPYYNQSVIRNYMESSRPL